MLTLGVTDFDDTVTIQVVTRAPDTYDENGNGIQGAEADPVDIQADVQPVTGRILQNLPEGVRDQVDLTVWSPYELLTGHVLIHDGQRYKVRHTWPRREDGFTKCVAGVTDSFSDIITPEEFVENFLGGEPATFPQVMGTYFDQNATILSGDENNILSLDLGGGYIFNKVGSGVVSRTANGYFFDGYAELQMTLPSPLLFTDLSMHAAVTFGAKPVSDADWGALNAAKQTIIGLDAGTDETTLQVTRGSRQFWTDLGPEQFGVRDAHNMDWLQDLRYESTICVGIHLANSEEYREKNAGSVAIFVNGSVAVSSFDANTIETDTVVLGRGFYGTIHEGVFFSKSPISNMWQDGTDVEMIHDYYLSRHPFSRLERIYS